MTLDEREPRQGREDERSGARGEPSDGRGSGAMGAGGDVREPLGGATSGAGGTRDLGVAADSITASRTPPGVSPSAGGGLRQHLRRNHDVYGVATALAGSLIAMASVWFALWQFDQQMEAQQRSTAVQLVNEFFTQVGELKANRRTGESESAAQHANRFVISRAQMLLDSEDTAVYADDIVRFLGANGYGGYFGKRPGEIGQRININHSALARMKLNDAHFKEASFTCVDFSGAVFENVGLNGSSISYSSLRSAVMISVDFTETYFSHVDLSGAHFFGQPHFDDASLYRSDLTGIHLSDAFVGNVPDADSLGEEERERLKRRNFAAKLATARTLFLTRLDPEVDRELARILGTERYVRKIMSPPFAGNSPSGVTRFIDANAVPSGELVADKCRSDERVRASLADASLVGG